jgi:PAS domain S-box-containing protein/putative nucleotidyltransferase with HDIG domain
MRIDQFVMSQGAIERLDDILLLTTRDGSILDANAAALIAYGRTHTELLELNVRDLRAPRYETLLQAQRNGAPDPASMFETENVRRDGTEFPVMVWSVPVVVTGEDAVLEVIHDITQRKSDEQALADSEARYRSLAENSPLGIFVNREDKVVLVNPACVRLFGASTPDDLVGMPALDLFDPDSQALVRERIIGAGETVELIEARIVRLDGTTVDVSVTAAPLPEEGVGAVQVLLRNITDRKASEAELRFRNAILATEQENSPDGILVVGGDGHVLSYNRRFAEIWDLPQQLLDEAIDESMIAVAADQVADRPAFIERIRYLNERRSESSSDEFALLDGRTFERYSAPMVGGDEYYGRVWYFHEITARRRMEQELRDTVTSITDVIGTVSEVRDPYTAGHQRRVAELCVEIARDLGMPANDIAELKTAALLHDVGKMSVPVDILTKPGRLSPTEFSLVQGHSEAGYRIISSARVPGPIAELVYEHHERCDGSGYPRGLVADQLLEGSKVLMVADVVEAMVSHRPYRASLGMEAALAEIERGAGRLYDARVAESCVRVIREQGFAFTAV